MYIVHCKQYNLQNEVNIQILIKTILEQIISCS